MKISKSKKELARIISENGGWKDKKAEWSAQDGRGGQVSFFKIKAPTYSKTEKEWMAFGDGVHCYGSRIEGCKVIKNFHQTILSREEYLHLYPTPDAKPQFCESVMRSIHEPEINSKNINITQVDDINVVESKQTIEQLAAEYQSKLAISTQAQEEADSHRCGAEVALSKLEIAVKELGFNIEPITAKQEPELVITDWRDLRVGDEIEVFNFECPDDESRRKQELMS